MQTIIQFFDFVGNLGHHIDGVFTAFGRGTVAGNTVCAHTDFHTTAMTAIDVQVRGFRNDDDFRSGIQNFFFHDDVPTQTVAVFFLNGTGDPQGVIAFQSQILNDLAGINHGRHTAFLIGSAATVDDAVFQFAFVRIAGPQFRIGDTDRVNMSVHGDNVFAVSDTTQNVAHLVDADFVKADFFHFLFNAQDNVFFLTGFRRNGNHIAQELCHIVAIFFSGLNDFCIHWILILSLDSKKEKGGASG